MLEGFDEEDSLNLQSYYIFNGNETESFNVTLRN